MKKIIIAGFILSVWVLFTGSVTAAPLNVVVSIKPLHSLVSGVMQGVGSPDLVVRSGGSPHGYSLRPSEAKALANADLVIWVGHELESFLEKPLSTLGKKSRQLTLAEELKVDLLTKRQGGTWETHMHKNNDDHGEHNHDGSARDLHIWLNPGLAKKIVSLVAEELTALDPEHAQTYQHNVQNMLARLDQLDRQLAEQLQPVKEVPYIVFHAAYQYFESAYDLNAVGSVTIDPERKPGARRIKAIRKKIKELDARCVFSEPQFESRLIQTIIEGTGTRTGILDPLGTDIPEGPQAYFTLMNRLADNLIEGLK